MIRRSAPIVGADAIFVAEPEELALPRLRRNARRLPRSKRVAGAPRKPSLPLISGDDYERALIRTAIVRSSTFDPDQLPQVNSPYEAALVLEHLVSADQEHFVTIAIDQTNHVVGIHETGIGPSGHVALSPADIVKVPILCGVRHFMIAHNHPSGDMRPSPEDVETSRKVREAGECVGVFMLDSFVVGYRGVYSLEGAESITWEQARKLAE